MYTADNGILLHPKLGLRLGLLHTMVEVEVEVVDFDQLGSLHIVVVQVERLWD